jgi:Fe-S cluster assembly iron-binding protein IscA
MANVTEGAKQELGRILASAKADDSEVCLRLVMGAGGQLSLVLDRETEGDQVVEHEESKVLLIGQELAMPLESVTIDCQETAEGPRLVISKV